MGHSRKTFEDVEPCYRSGFQPGRVPNSSSRAALAFASFRPLIFRRFYRTGIRVLTQLALEFPKRAHDPEAEKFAISLRRYLRRFLGLLSFSRSNVSGLVAVLRGIENLRDSEVFLIGLDFFELRWFLEVCRKGILI